MMQTPTIETRRLNLRPLALSDAPAIQRHFDNWNIIKNLATLVPWPYPQDGAETFIKRELDKIASGEQVYQWVLVLRSGDSEAIGNIRFEAGTELPSGNRGFWLAEPYWNQGLMTEAVAAVDDFVFGALGLERFYACNVITNQASRRVKEKTGARFIGYVELPNHSGKVSERWEVSRESWLARQGHKKSRT
jgi:ribosomal-protein-alanine N-acetyltransferase